MFQVSCEVTVKAMAVPALAAAGAETTRRVAGPPVTTMAAELPVIDAVTVSVAVIDWLPAVFSVTATVPVPLVSVASDGSTADVSLLVKWTVPP